MYNTQAVPESFVNRPYYIIGICKQKRIIDIVTIPGKNLYGGKQYCNE